MQQVCLGELVGVGVHSDTYISLVPLISQHRVIDYSDVGAALRRLAFDPTGERSHQLLRG